MIDAAEVFLLLACPAAVAKDEQHLSRRVGKQPWRHWREDERSESSGCIVHIVQRTLAAASALSARDEGYGRVGHACGSVRLCVCVCVCVNVCV